MEKSTNHKNKIHQLLLNRLEIKNKKNKNRKTQREEVEHTKDWCTFYRRNWNIYAEHELGINLKPFQHFMLYMMGRSSIFYLMCSRGLGKTFLSAVGAIIICMLYPYSTVVVTATTMETAKKIVTDKIEVELCQKISSKLQWMYKNSHIKISDNKDRVIVKFIFNHSIIQVMPESESSRGTRATAVIFEEARILKRYSVQSIFRPMKSARKPAFLNKSEYQNASGNVKDERLIEHTRMIYITSTKYKYMWFWEYWKTCVNNMFGQNNSRYCCFAGDIITSIAHGFLKEQEVKDEKDGSTDIDFRTEYLNEPQGEVEGSFYSLENFVKNRVVVDAFHPPSNKDFVFKYLKGDIPYFREKRDEEVRLLTVDFAFADTVKGKAANDNTVIGCLSGYPDEDRNFMLKNGEYLETFSGGQKIESILRIREIFHLYKADYLLIDFKNGGEDRFRDLALPYYHKEWGMELPGLNIVFEEDILREFCNLEKVNTVRKTLQSTNTIPVVVPVVGTKERNNNFHIAMKSVLENNTFRLPIESDKFQKEYLDAAEYMSLDNNGRMRMMLPYVQFDIMVIDEAIKLEQTLKDGYIALKEPRSGTKDRIIAVEYGNYLLYLLEIKLKKSNINSNINFDDYILCV